MTITKELWILLKYKLLMWGNIPKRRGKRSMPKWVYALIILIVFVSFGVPGYFLMLNVFTNYAKISLNSITLADLFLEISLLGILGLVILIDTPAISLNVFMSDDLEYLLTLPLSQTAIFYSKMIESIVEGTFPALFFIPLLLAYGNAIGMTWYALVFAFVMYIFYVLFCSGISGLLSLIISKFASKSGMRRFMMLSSMATMALAYFTMNIVNMPSFNSQNMQSALNAYVAKLNFFLWPSTWFLSSVKGNLIGSFVLISVSLGVFALSYYMTSKSVLLGFSNVTSAARKLEKTGKYQTHGSFGALIIKEFRSFRREPSIMFFLVYPAVFPVFIILLNDQRNLGTLMMGELTGIFMASMYIIYAMASLVSIDVKVGWILKTMPIGETSPLWAKALVVSGSFLIVITAMFSIFSVFFGGFLTTILIAVLSIPIFLLLSFFGVYAVTKWPNPSGGAKRALNTTGSLISMPMGFVGALVVGMQSFYLLNEGRIWHFSFLLSTFLFMVLPIATEIVLTVSVKHLISKIDWSEPFENRVS